MKSIQGQFLIAAPTLEDPNFFRTVVLMLQHDEEGAMGLVLNRASSKPLREIWSQVSPSPCRSDEPIFVGGPVQGPLLALHQAGELADTLILPGVFVASQRESLEQLVGREGVFRAFLGYAGWGAGQLEAEMQMEGWLTLPATAELVFSDPDSLWSEVTQQADHEFFRRLFPRGETPPDPRLN